MISEIGVLGPVRLVPESGSGLGGRRQRRLLAALVVNTGNVVSTDRLVDVVFEGSPTDAASTTLRSYVARLRRALEGSGAILATRSPGYVLEPGAATIDADRFERSLTEATAHRLEGRVTEALDCVNDGLSLWRGPAYAEFADEEWAHAEALRLDELRVQAEEVRLGCLVDLGRHDEALPDVAAFIERHPLREQARLLLLIALFEASTGSHVGELAGFDAEDSFVGLDFSPDGRSIVSLTCPVEQEDVCDAVLNLHDVGTGDRMAGPVDAGPVDFRVVNGVEFTPDGTKVVSVTADSEVVIRDVPSFGPTTDPLDLAEVSVAPGLRTIVVTSGERHGREFVAALGDFGPTVVWDRTDEPRPVGAIESPSNGIWFGPEGELFVGSVYGPVLIYDPLTLEVIGPPFPSDEPALRFSLSDTGVLAINSNLGGTMLWDVETREPISGDLPGWISDVDPDGNVLYLGAMGFDEGGVRVAALPLDLDGLAADACHRAGRNLTADEWRRYMPEDTPYRPTCPEWPVS